MPSKIIIEGNRAKVVDGKDLAIPQLLERCGPLPDTAGVLPRGVKAVLSRGPLTLWFWEQPPRLVQLSWIKETSTVPFGRGATYRKVKIALPYLVIMASFSRDNSGLPTLNTHSNECFFRNKPLVSLDDELCYPGLLNCSVMEGSGSPLAWICTQYLKQDSKASSNKPEERYHAGLEAVRYCLLETSFNLSSEHHEGNSWYNRSKAVDPRISTIKDWEANTKKDPLFVTEVPWIPTRHTVRQLAERTLKRLGQAAGFATAEDLARIINNYAK